jgi:hypothetical protein
VDGDKELALRRAEQVSRLWHASIIGLTVDECKLAIARGSKLRKILVNHLILDSVRRALRGRRVDIIPIEIRYTEQTIQSLARINDSTVLLLLPPHAVSSARYIVEQLHKWMRCVDTRITWMRVTEVSDFKRLLQDSRYGRILVTPGARGKVPAALHSRSHFLFLQMELDAEDLEIARIRAGIIV